MNDWLRAARILQNGAKSRKERCSAAWRSCHAATCSSGCSAVPSWRVSVQRVCERTRQAPCARNGLHRQADEGLCSSRARLESDSDLKRWVEICLGFVDSLPPKKIGKEIAPSGNARCVGIHTLQRTLRVSVEEWIRAKLGCTDADASSEPGCSRDQKHLPRRRWPGGSATRSPSRPSRPSRAAPLVDALSRCCSSVNET